MNSLPPRHPTAAMLLLATFMLLPPAVAYLFPVSSFTAGTIAACIVGLAQVPLGWTAQVLAKRAFWSTVAALALALSIHFIGASFVFQTDAIRFVGSAVILILVFATASASSMVIYGGISKAGISRIFLLMLVFAVMAQSGIVVPGANITLKSVFPFTEPSFFGLAFLPLLLFCTASAQGVYRFAYIVIGIAAALVLQNLTMLAGTFLILLAISRVGGIVVMTSLLVGALLFSGLDLTYYTERLNFSSENNNVSTLAYLQGWQMMDESLSMTSGWGVGFSQMGINGSEVDAAELIYAIVGDYMNLNDGTFIFSRLVSDFGLLGIVVTLFYLGVVRRSLLSLRNYSFRRVQLAPGAALAHSIIVMSVIDVFVRGIGYLTGSMIIFLAACQFLYGLHARPHVAHSGARPRAA
jgi:hypothetical protein